MATSLLPFGLFIKSLLDKLVDIDSDTIKAMLVTSAYTPDIGTHQFKSSVTNEATGTGYTAGGVTVTGVSVALTLANSWGTSRANTTAYALGAIVRPATGNGYLYEAVAAGTSGGSIPTYPTVIGQTVSDGGVTWVCRGRGIVIVDATGDPSWASLTTTARYIVFYDSSPASDATRPLICYGDFGADVSPVNGTLTWTIDTYGLFSFVI